MSNQNDDKLRQKILERAGQISAGTLGAGVGMLGINRLAGHLGRENMDKRISFSYDDVPADIQEQANKTYSKLVKGIEPDIEAGKLEISEADAFRSDRVSGKPAKSPSVTMQHKGKTLIRARDFDDLAHELGHYKTDRELAKSTIGRAYKNSLHKVMTSPGFAKMYALAAPLGTAAMVDRDTSTAVMAAPSLLMLPRLVDEGLANRNMIRSMKGVAGSNRYTKALGSMLGYTGLAASPLIAGKIKQKLMELSDD